jgi:signal transduction histidine kinase
MYNLTASGETVDIPTNPPGKFERIAELARGLHAAHEGNSYLLSLVSAAVELTDSETASILDYDPEAGHLAFRAVPWFHSDALSSIQIPLEGSVAGWVVRNCEPVIVPDVSRDERHFKQADVLSGYKTKSILAVPLQYQERVTGVFQALNKADDADYTDEDLLVMQALAGLACSAIETDLLERRIKKSLEDMAALDRLKSDFIAISSHELRTPLGLIMGHATFLREMLDGKYSEQVDAIIRNAGKLKEIVELLSNVDNYEAGTARLRERMVSVKQIAREVTANFEPLAQQKHIQLETELGNTELLVEGEGSKIAIALSNLVKNALTFTNEGGKVLIKAEALPGYVQVSVIDNGIGIPAADLPRIFERFYQVDSHLTRRFGGMGLGLSVAKAMIDLHGGRMWAESTEGEGSTFSFLLPEERPQSTAAVNPFTT